MNRNRIYRGIRVLVVAAGGDIVTAMQSFSYGEDEIHEVMCILASLKDQVVLN